MKTILIAGAGQLGSRHLQGVKTSKYELDIWVYDLSDESLKVAEERYNQVDSNNKSVHFVNTLEVVPSEIDVVIVASSSKPRAAIVSAILASKAVKYMVLEKFLFPRLSEYEEIGSLIKQKQVKTWVNCPRRMWKGYEIIKQMIDKSKPIECLYEGGEWGMCCNTIHFVDAFMYLNGMNHFSVNLNGLIQEVVDSKRAGYVEVHGTEVFTTANGSVLKLTSLPDYKGESHLVIRNGNTAIEYNEGKGLITFNGERITVSVHYQSGLSGILVDELIETGMCRLASYDQSASYHIAYLSEITPFINRIKEK